jgi:hypothetical protein
VNFALDPFDYFFKYNFCLKKINDGFIKGKRNNAVVFQKIREEDIKGQVFLLRPGVDRKVRLGEADYTRIAASGKIMINFTNLCEFEMMNLLFYELLEMTEVDKFICSSYGEIGHNVKTRNGFAGRRIPVGRLRVGKVQDKLILVRIVIIFVIRLGAQRHSFHNCAVLQMHA